MENIVLIGAGSAVFTRGLVADLISRGTKCRLALVDTDPHALLVAEKLVAKMIEARRAPVRLAAATDRRDVLRGATAVICTIGVGGRRAWEQDVFIPRAHGIYQPVGDSVMPGGASRALRMIPAMVAIARDVLDLCPAALFFNYGNPMAPVCRAVRKATGANMTGLCHGVYHVSKHIASLLGVQHERLRYTAVGINHLTWFIDVRFGRTNAMRRLVELAGKKVRETRTALDRAGRKTDGPLPTLDDPFTWELVSLFNAYPAVGDRHITEFFPHLHCRKGQYYGRTLGVDAFSFERTIENGDRGYNEMRELALSKKPLPGGYFDRLAGEHEQVLDIIASIRAGRGDVYSANLPNRGIVPNLPREAVVESPAVAGRRGLHAVPQPALPSSIAGTLASRFMWVETIVEAALQGSTDKFVRALLLDGAVTGVAQARALADDLLKAHAQYLPQFKSRAPMR
ncbi:hypothetical protein GX586_01705 [bacterium]|nr:hypothetical protein [bacterium]